MAAEQPAKSISAEVNALLPKGNYYPASGMHTVLCLMRKISQCNQLAAICVIPKFPQAEDAADNLKVLMLMFSALLAALLFGSKIAGIFQVRNILELRDISKSCSLLGTVSGIAFL